MTTPNTKENNTPKYTQGSFDRELNYKMWSTYKARFNASDRMQKKHTLSTRCIALLSAYVAIFSVITTVFEASLESQISDILLVVGVSLSIVILVIGLLETSQNYSVRADRYHQSGLDISELYKELRTLKSRYPNKCDTFYAELERIRKSYDDILQRSQNHETIDHLTFITSKPDYEDHNLSRDEVKANKKALSRQFLPYYLSMIIPPVIFIGAMFFLQKTDSAEQDAAPNLGPRDCHSNSELHSN